MTEPRRSYTILAVIGQGGFGTVYRAEMRGSDGFRKVVAVKMMRAHEMPEEDLRRFRDEARILGLVRDRAIVSVDPPTRLAGRLAVVMEYIEGCSAATLVRQGAVPVSVALEITQEIARVLDKVVRLSGPDGRPLNLLHRDLKPGNIQITPGWRGEDPRLRHRPRHVRRARGADHGKCLGHPRVHGARTVVRRGGPRGRHLLARRGAPRDDHTREGCHPRGLRATREAGGPHGGRRGRPRVVRGDVRARPRRAPDCPSGRRPVPGLAPRGACAHVARLGGDTRGRVRGAAGRRSGRRDALGDPSGGGARASGAAALASVRAARRARNDAPGRRVELRRRQPAIAGDSEPSRAGPPSGRLRRGPRVGPRRCLPGRCRPGACCSGPGPRLGPKHRARGTHPA